LLRFGHGLTVLGVAAICPRERRDPRVQSNDPQTDLGNRRRRILFRATHRGTYENDILIGNFVRNRLAAFSEVDLDALEEVMELPDAMLADWLTGRQPIPADVDTPMLRAIRRAAEDGEGQPGNGA
jgi:antitoxin CptB